MTRLLRVLALPAAVLLLLTGCSSDDSPDSAPSSTPSGSPSASPTDSPSTDPSAKASAAGTYTMDDYKAAVLAVYDEKGEEALKGAPFTIDGREQFSCMVNAFAKVQDIDKMRSGGTPDENTSAIFLLGDSEERPSAAQVKKLLDGIDDCSIDLRPGVTAAITNGIGQNLTDKTQLDILTSCVNTIPDNLMREFMIVMMSGGETQSEAMTAWQKKAEECLTDKGYNPTSKG